MLGIVNFEEDFQGRLFWGKLRYVQGRLRNVLQGQYLVKIYIIWDWRETQLMKNHLGKFFKGNMKENWIYFRFFWENRGTFLSEIFREGWGIFCRILRDIFEGNFYRNWHDE